MTRPAATPLERLAHRPGFPAVWLKREDLLPHGGGAKVRRFLAYLDALAPGDTRPLVALSERGAHTFVTLAQMQADGVLDRPLVFLEGRGPRTPYAEANRARYLGRPRIRLLTGPLTWLLLRHALFAARPRTYARLGLGGQTPGGTAAAEAAYREVHAQLGAAGPHAGRTIHVVAAASGTLATGLLAGMTAAGASDLLWAVPTGPPPTHGRLRQRFGRDARVTLLAGPPASEGELEAATREMRAASGCTLDPRHVARAWLAALRAAPSLAAPGDRLVLWVTGPHLPAAPPAP